MSLIQNNECGFETVRYFKSPEYNPNVKLPAIYGRCVIHQTSSRHEFQNASDAFRFFRCDPKNRIFLFAGKYNQIPPFTGDLTELAYRIYTQYEDRAYRAYGDDYYVIWLIGEIQGAGLHMFPVTVNVLSHTSDKENDYSYVKIQACDIEGDELTTVTVQIDDRH